MALKKITENPKITDTILFEIETPDGEGCFYENPYKVDSVTIYHIERDFLGTNYGNYDLILNDKELEKIVKEMKEIVCGNPSEENVNMLKEAVNKLESSQVKTSYYYKDRNVINVFGNAEFPAWISTDLDNANLINVSSDSDGNTQYGKFTLEWSPNGKAREGDYIICWTWTPLAAGSKLSAHLPFFLYGDSKAVTSIPTHVTPEDKYETLLERYLPEVYKTTLSHGDLTPQTTLKFNRAIADGFTFTENFANQIIDLLDANALHESLLMYLSNFFNLKLKSNDPTLWRRQIKEAIPLFKKKGTYSSIQEAFAQAGMVLNKYIQFWQIVSPYTYQESFKVDSIATWKLEKDNIILPIDESNFGLWLRRKGTLEYIELNKDYVEFEINDQSCEVTMSWIGDELESNSITLKKGDYVRVLYQYNEIPDSNAQQIENYILSLPLSDSRDESAQSYPPKNWNVHLIDEEDPLFNVLVPVKHPFHDPIVFGHIRTEFPYGENIYNMEEYNGSTRPSYDVCAMDKEFVDPCGSCLSSKYSVDIGVEELSNDRMLESQNILDEYMPFHAQLHSINFTGEVVEFVNSPVEALDFLITLDKTENHLSGQANPFFNRIMDGGLNGDWVIDRSDLADKNTVNSGKTGIGFNSEIVIISPNLQLEDLGIKPLGNHVLEVLSPSPNAGVYKLKNVQGKLAVVDTTVAEPLNESQFTFKLSNIIYDKSSSVSITQANKFTLKDANLNFSALGVKTNWDVENVPNYTGATWKISIPSLSATNYEIENIVNGELILVNNANTLTNGTFSYVLLNDSDEEIDSSTTGIITIEERGLVNLNDGYLINNGENYKIGYFLYYDNSEYEIIELVSTNLNFYIKGWSDGDVAGASIEIRNRLVKNAVGQFGYRGLELQTSFDHELEFEIVNGSNPSTDITDNDKFKESYMFLINDQFFKILEWDSFNLKLAGRPQNWKTLSAGGTSVPYKIIHFPKKQINVQFIVFDHLDRSGHDPIIRTIEDLTDMNQAITALSSGQSSGIQEQLGQNEDISFIIEKLNGNTEEGEI